MANEIIPILSGDDRRALRALRARSSAGERRAEAAARRIVADVRRRGAPAVLAWTRRFAPAAPARAAASRSPLRPIPAAELEAAWRRLPAGLRAALRLAARNIEQMARWQRPKTWRRRMAPGARVGQLVRPLASVGCYVPGGRHPLPSSLLMTAIPARVAGVPRLVAVCPRPADAVLAAAFLAGVTEFYPLGGAQAIAALAYGAGRLAPVDKIVGPGNSFVTAAKKLVAADCGIDFLAGPTEVLLLAEGGENPAFLAADLLAQAEHDPEAAAWLLTPSRRLALATRAALAAQLRAAPNPVARVALRRRGALIVTRDLPRALALANEFAPEHITAPAARLEGVRNAGSIFLGEHAPQAVGDYLSGANHVLPTGRWARLRGGLSVADFLKVITTQELTPAALRAWTPAIAALARAEGLEAHARSVEIRAAAPPARTRARKRGEAARAARPAPASKPGDAYRPARAAGGGA